MQQSEQSVSIVESALARKSHFCEQVSAFASSDRWHEQQEQMAVDAEAARVR